MASSRIFSEEYAGFEKFSPDRTAVWSGENSSSFGSELQFSPEKLFHYTGAC